MAKKNKSAEKARGGAPRWFSRPLLGTHDHFSGELPAKFPFFMQILFRVLFRHVKISDRDVKRIQDLSEKGALLYVIRNKSRLEFLMLAFLFKEKHVPAPRFAHYIAMYFWQSFAQTARRTLSRIVSFVERSGYPNPYQSGYVETLLKNGEPTLLPARHFAGLPWRFTRKKTDPLADVIRIAQEIKKPIYLVPIEFAYGRNPDFEFAKAADLMLGSKVNPSKIRQILMLLTNWKSTTILVGEPMLLEDEVEEAKILAPKTSEVEQEIAYAIRTRCIDRINRERRVILGPVLKSRSEVIEEILHEPDVFDFLQDLSKADKKDFVELRRDARKMLQEIASDYNPTTVRIMTGFLRFAFKRLYAGMEVNLDRLDTVRTLAAKMPVVYIPCHKSHLDYLILSYLLFENNMSVPYVASGVNLNFWPIGKIFRGGGAFFMRRTFRGKRLYSMAFSKYVQYLVREGNAIEFFIEGTRSRTGKIVLPKLGFLSILLEAVRATDQKNLCIVPVSINYEHIFEKTFYLNEAAGKKNEGENISTLIRHRKMVKQKLGRMYLQIAEPFMLSDLLTDCAGRIPKQRADLMDLAAKMANRVAVGINDYTIATPFTILSAVLLSEGKRGFRLEEIQQGADLILGYLNSAGVRVVGLHSGWVDQALKWCEHEKILTSESEEDDEDTEKEDTFYFLDEDKRLTLTLYKNSIVHHYSFIALLSMCFLASDGPSRPKDLFDQFNFIKTLMNGELIYRETPEGERAYTRQVYDIAMEFFTGHGFIIRGEADLLVLSKQGRQAARIFAGSTLDFVGSYSIVAKTLWKHRKKKQTDKQWVQKAMRLGKRLTSTGEIRRAEAVHKNIIASGLKHFKSIGICNEEDSIDEKFRRTIYYQVGDFTRLSELIDRLQPFSEL